MKVTIHQAKTQLAEQTSRPLGVDRDSVRIADDFDAPLPAAVLPLFLGGGNASKRQDAKKPSKRRA